jgi:NitT/TauT family transport system substrate-binding protein
MRRGAIIAVAGALVLAGCNPLTHADPKAGFDKLTVSAFATVDSAPLYLGRAKGLFDKQKIDLTITTVPNSAGSIAAAAHDQAPIGLANTTALLVAQSQGADIKVLANGVSSTGTPGHDFSAILVKADSDVQSAADLGGVKVGVTQLKSIGDTTVRASIRKVGGDPSKVKFVDVPFADGQTKLDAGEVGAVWAEEPYLSAGLAQGDRAIAWNFADTVPNLTTAMYFTTGKYATAHADLIQRFTTALTESLKYATAHENESRQILTSYLQADSGVLGKMVLPKWPAQVNKASVQRLADLARGDGVLTKPVDVASLVPAP